MPCAQGAAALERVCLHAWLHLNMCMHACLELELNNPSPSSNFSADCYMFCLRADSDRQELFEQLVTAGQPTVSALDEFRTSLLGRYGQPCVDDFPRLVWE
eukprot:2524881-Pleurochrysis_carterae.AAC.1